MQPAVLNDGGPSTLLSFTGIAWCHYYPFSLLENGGNNASANPLIDAWKYGLGNPDVSGRCSCLSNMPARGRARYNRLSSLAQGSSTSRPQARWSSSTLSEGS